MIESSLRVRDDLVADPVQQWRQGQGAVDIQGFWPADYDVAWAA